MDGFRRAHHEWRRFPTTMVTRYEPGKKKMAVSLVIADHIDGPEQKSAGEWAKLLLRWAITVEV
ncbi:hypothetical protein RvY_08714 [Ramazzottius varieornatus]|uniref:Uncharacterized protein n=1 Tax=Ramazzottius varieornatus TaxID=947166 RepID=A0A1D1VG03_RAMVA|nr:hypothetical protein RvY_08714 [Ramazzottius varieornatus]